MNAKIIANGFAALLVKRFAGPFWIRRRWLEKTQWFSRQELQELQLKLLKRLIRHCYRTVPFYRSLMDNRGIKVEDINTLDDIKLFPILTKKDVLGAGDSIISSKYPKWALRKARTGGSTGTPLVIHRNWFSIGNEHAFIRRQWDWAGLSLSDRSAYFMSRVVAEPDQQGGCLYAYDPAMRDLILSTHHLSAETARDYAEVIKSYKIKVLIGYPSALGFLATTCLDSGIELSLQAALTTSELLTQSIRDTIATAFNCKVYDYYGSAERVCYIHTCEHGSYHVIPEYGLTELIPVNESDPCRCRVVSTGFWNFGMPLIRYDTGDVVVKTDRTCACGRQFQVIKSIDGREGDIIVTSSGRHLGVTLMIQLLYVICGTRHIAESQIIQDSVDHLTIEYVPTGKFRKEDLEEFKKLIAKYLPSELDFDFKAVKAVKRTESGKIRPLVSRISC